MTLDKIVEQIHKNICEPVVLPKAKVDLSIINKFKHIDVMEFYYDDKEHPDDNTWIDIEGIGYGQVIKFVVIPNSCNEKQLENMLFIYFHY